MIINNFGNIASKTYHFKKGEQIFAQEDLVKDIYYVIRGRIKLVRNTIEGTPVIIHVAYANEGIAEASLFSDKYHCSALVDTNTVVMGVTKEKLLNHLQNHPKSMMDLIQQLTSQIRDLRMFNEIKSIHSAREKILAYLSTRNANTDADLPLKDIAHKIGMTHETLYRVLKTLENEGKINRNKSRIQLL